MTDYCLHSQLFPPPTLHAQNTDPSHTRADGKGAHKMHQHRPSMEKEPALSNAHGEGEKEPALSNVHGEGGEGGLPLR